jgi:hypothetical protein
MPPFAVLAPTGFVGSVGWGLLAVLPVASVVVGMFGWSAGVRSAGGVALSCFFWLRLNLRRL